MKRRSADDIAPDDYSEEAERKIIRLQLYKDLKWEGGPAVYPSTYPSFAPGAADKATEPSLDEWRRGYLVLKGNQQQQKFLLQTIVALAVIFVALWALKRAGVL